MGSGFLSGRFAVSSTERPINPVSSEEEATFTILSQPLAAGLLDVAAATHRGGRRENQDRYLVDADLNLMVVADGVGGLKEGGRAAELVCQSIQADVKEGLLLDDAVSRSTTVVASESEKLGVAGGMGSTVVAVLWQGARFELKWVGDSSARAYLGGAWRALTRDHSEASELVTQGILTESAAFTHPKKHVLTQALGITSSHQLRIGGNAGGLHHNEWLVLSSDGLTNALSNRDIAAVLGGANSAQAAASSLMDLALEMRPTDNVTLIAMRWLGPDSHPADAPRVYAN